MGSQRRFQATLGLILPVVLGGCSDTELRQIYEQPVIHEQPDALGPTAWVDEFQQRTVLASDILFVVDDSCSMVDEQEELSDNFNLFIENFVGTDLDYHIGVTRAALSGGSNPFDPANPLAWGELETLPDGSRWIDPDTADHIGAFNDIANVGTGGGDCEMALQASFSALHDRSAPGGTNEGFYRPDANLTMVLISDENDHGADGPALNACGGIDPSEYVNWLLALKGYNHQDKISFTGIVGGPGGCNANGNEADAAPAYMEAIEGLGGNFLSICSDDWSGFLTELGLEAAGLERSFQLRRIPVESTLEVTVDGEAPPSGAWSYDRTRNSIDFPIETIPAELARIRVAYVLQEDLAGVLPE